MGNVQLDLFFRKGKKEDPGSSLCSLGKLWSKSFEQLFLNTRKTWRSCGEMNIELSRAISGWWTSLIFIMSSRLLWTRGDHQRLCAWAPLGTPLVVVVSQNLWHVGSKVGGKSAGSELWSTRKFNWQPEIIGVLVGTTLRTTVTSVIR